MFRDEGKLQLLHRKLQLALTQLDELDCPLGSAHLASAINALERESSASVLGASRHDARHYALALHREAGDRAEEIARQQLRLAEGAAQQSWFEILQYLRSMH